MLYFLTDVFGFKFLNNQLLADQYAQEGFYVVMPDLFNGDAIGENQLNPRPGFDPKAFFGAWFPNHTTVQVDPIIEAVRSAIAEQYKPKFSAASGYCYGTKYCIRMLGTETSNLQSAALFHPSFTDLAEVNAIIGTKQTVFVCAPDNDSAYTKELRHQTEDIFKEKADTLGFRYKCSLLHGVGHGFAVRGDISDPWIKLAKEQAFADAVEWFKGSEKIL